jgi:hypothetical protein
LTSNPSPNPDPPSPSGRRADPRNRPRTFRDARAARGRCARVSRKEPLGRRRRRAPNGPGNACSEAPRTKPHNRTADQLQCAPSQSPRHNRDGSTR